MPECVSITRNQNDENDGNVPAMVILRRKTMYKYRTTVELLGEFVRVEKFRQGKAKAFDPILCCQIGGRKRCEATVRRTAYDGVAVRFCDWPSGLLDLTSEEFVEVAVFRRVRLHLASR